MCAVVVTKCTRGGAAPPEIFVSPQTIVLYFALGNKPLLIPSHRTVLYAFWVCVCIFLLFFPLSSNPTTFLPDDGDALQGLYVQSWVAHQFPKAPLEIFDSNFYYPHPTGLVYSEHLIPQGLVVALLMKLGANLILANNLVLALTLLMIALFVRLWARELGVGETGAAVAGVVCALSTFTLLQASRVQILSMQWIPLCLFFLHRFFRRGRWLDAAAFAACFVLLGLSCQYYLISFPLFLVPVVAGYVYLFPDRRNLRDAFRLGVPLFFGCLLLVPVELPYLKIFHHYGFERALSEGPDLAYHLLPPPDNFLYGWLTKGMFKDLPGNHHFIGYLTMVLAVLGAAFLLRRRNDAGPRSYRWLIAWIASWGVFFLILSAGAEVKFMGRGLGPGPFGLLFDYVPFFQYTRVPERLSVYFTFGLALLAGAGASVLSKRLVRWPRAKTVLPLILLALIPLEHARRNVYARIPTEDEIPAVYHWLAELPEDFPVVEFPVYDRRFLRFYGYETYFSTVHWKRVPFGKPSFKPPAMEYMLWTWRDFPSSEGTRLLQSLGVRYIIYHPRRDPNAARVNRRLRQDPNFEFVRQFPRAMRIARRLRYGEEMVFRVLPASEPLSPPPQVEERLRAIPRDAWEFKTSSQSDARLAVDGSLETSWSSGKGQEKGQFFEIDLEGEYRVSKISLGFSFPYGHFPRSLAVNGFHPSVVV